MAAAVLVGSLATGAAACGVTKSGSPPALTASPGAAVGAAVASPSGSKASTGLVAPLSPSGGASASGAAAGTPAAGTPTAGSPAIGQEVSAAQPKIVEDGDVQVQVKRGSLQSVFDAIQGLANGAGGFVSDSSMSNGAGAASARLVLRVANADVHQLLGSLPRYGTITSQSLSGRDVTGQAVDLAARITTLQAEENALRALLSDAKAIGDILSIQNQLFDLQSQIEQLTGQQNTLSDQTTYATVSVELTETGAAPPPPPRPKSRPSALSRAWHLARTNTVAVVRGIVLAVGWLTPLLVVAALAAIPLAVWWRRRRRTATTPRPPAGLDPGAPAA